MAQNRTAPTSVNRKVDLSTPIRLPNSELRVREYLTPDEVIKLVEAAKGTGYGLRDSTLILVVYRHGLRAQEASDLEWSAVDWKGGGLHVRRAKGGKPSVHPIRGDELRMLRTSARSDRPVDF